MDNLKIQNAIRELLIGLGEDPNRPGLIETPKRVAKMYEEVLEGIQYSNHDIAKMYGKVFEQSSNSSSVVMKDISVFSYCEHHLALMYDMTVNVSYIPNGKVIGLSKIARICEMASKRLQLQERLCNDISEIISEATGSNDVGVKITGSHSCMTARGIKNVNSKTTTYTLKGKYQNDDALRNLLD